MSQVIFDNKLLQIVLQFYGNLFSNFINGKMLVLFMIFIQNESVVKRRKVYNHLQYKRLAVKVTCSCGQREENGLLFDLNQLRQNPNEPTLEFFA